MTVRDSLKNVLWNPDIFDQSIDRWIVLMSRYYRSTLTLDALLINFDSSFNTSLKPFWGLKWWLLLLCGVIKFKWCGSNFSCTTHPFLVIANWYPFACFSSGRSIITKKGDGSQVKESTDSSTTLEDDDLKGKSLLTPSTWRHTLYTAHRVLNLKLSCM